MFKFIFIAALMTTSIASACKISRAGMSHSVLTAVSEYTLKSISTDSAIKAVYRDAGDNSYLAEILDAKDECSAQLYEAYFDTLNCGPKVTPVATFVPIPCKK